MSFNIISDIHLEKFKAFPSRDELNDMLPATAPYLLVAGDVCDIEKYFGIFLAFIAVCCSKYKRVFFIPGNHEYYVSSFAWGIDQINAKLKECEKIFTSLKILLNECVLFGEEKLVLFGGTMWSCLPPTSELKSIPIYSTNSVHITTDTWNQLHSEFKRNLEATIFLCPAEYKLIVVSHHAPTFINTLSPKYEGKPYNEFYCTEILKEFCTKISCWIFGHTGWNCDYAKDNTRVLSNQYTVGDGTLFRKDLVLTL